MMDENAALQKGRHFCVAAKVMENSPFLLFINYFIDAFVISIFIKASSSAGFFVLKPASFILLKTNTMCIYPSIGSLRKYQQAVRAI